MDIKIPVAEFMKNRSANSDIHLSVIIGQIDDGAEGIKVLSPVKADGTMYMIGNVLNFNIHIKTSLGLICSRCLQPFERTFENDISEQFTLDRDNKDADITFLDGDSLNVTEIITEDIILSLPMKRLCKDDCKGLCPVCGTNLNFSSCNCSKNEIDPRLAKLKDLF